MPCSVNATRRSPKRSKTPPKIISHSGRRAHHRNSTLGDPHLLEAVALYGVPPEWNVTGMPSVTQAAHSGSKPGGGTRGGGVAGRQHDADEPARGTQRTSATASSMSWGWTMATPPRRFGQLPAEVGQPTVEDPGPGQAKLGRGRPGNGNAAAQGGSLLFWKSGNRISATMPSRSSRGCVSRSPTPRSARRSSGLRRRRCHHLARRTGRATSSPSSRRPIGGCPRAPVLAFTYEGVEPVSVLRVDEGA